MAPISVGRVLHYRAPVTFTESIYIDNNGLSYHDGLDLSRGTVCSSPAVVCGPAPVG